LRNLELRFLKTLASADAPIISITSRSFAISFFNNKSWLLQFDAKVPVGIFPWLFNQSTLEINALVGDMGERVIDWAISGRFCASKLFMIQLSWLSFPALDQFFFAQLSLGVCAHL
jgi:hypothetical protein